MNYFITVEEVYELADAIAFLDGLIGLPEAKNKISRAHQILEKVLGEDSGLVYAMDADAA